MSKTRWITGAQVVDVAAGSVSPPQAIAVTDGRIAAFAPSAPAGAETIDAGGLFAAPGLIDAHVHFFLAGDATPLRTFVASSDEQRLATAEHNARLALQSGITTMRDCGAPAGLMSELRARVARDPARGPHLVTCGAPLTRKAGHLHFFGEEVATTLEVRSAVARQLEAGNEFIKLITSGGGLTPGTDPAEADLPEPLIAEAVTVAHANSAPVAAHCHATESIVRALEAGVDVIEHASFITRTGYAFDADIACRLRDAGTIVSPTVMGALRSAAEFRKMGQGHNRADITAIERLEGRLKNSGRFRELGMKIVAGTDAGVTNTGFDALVEELLAYASVGFSHAEALRTATCDAADYLRLGRCGQLREGFQADLVLLRGNPMVDLAALRAPLLVMKSGEVMHAAPGFAGTTPPAPAYVVRGAMAADGAGRVRAREATAVAVAEALELRSPVGHDEMEQYFDLRWRILRQPWSQTRGEERDELEGAATHVGAWSNGQLVGVGRVHFIAAHEAQIRYMAVESGLQGRGIGAQILGELERCAHAAGAQRVVLNARDRAVHFYQRHGYVVTRESGVLFDAIPHWQMEKQLAAVSYQLATSGDQRGEP